MESNPLHCTLTDSELSEKAQYWIDSLVKSGGKAFVMHVPARPNEDPDLIFAELDQRFLAKCFELASLKAQPGAVWTPASTKPEHNVGVLVFIPGEDNHVTSGMWDISNQWVLLDEYRTPEEEVTHWMPLPAFPEGYKHDVISDEWVSTLKAIAKEELAKKESAAGREEDAVAFAQWLANERWQPRINTEWARYETIYSDVSVKTTAELYELFKQQKEK